MLQNRLNVLIAQKGYSIKKVHDDTGLSRTTISNLVNNVGGGIQSVTLNRLCLYFGITPADFFDFVPFDLSYDAVADKLSALNIISVNDDPGGSYFNLIISADNGQLSVNQYHFRVGVFFFNKGLSDPQDYKVPYSAYVYVAGWSQDKHQEEALQFKRMYFDKMPAAFQEQFYTSCTQHIVEYVSLSFAPKRLNFEADSDYKMIVNLPYGRTVEASIIPK